MLSTKFQLLLEMTVSTVYLNCVWLCPNARNSKVKLQKDNLNLRRRKGVLHLPQKKLGSLKISEQKNEAKENTHTKNIQQN